MKNTPIKPKTTGKSGTTKTGANTVKVSKVEKVMKIQNKSINKKA